MMAPNSQYRHKWKDCAIAGVYAIQDKSACSVSVGYKWQWQVENLQHLVGSCMQPWEAMAFDARKTPPGEQAEKEAHLRLLPRQGHSTGAINCYLKCSVHASYIDYRELHVVAVQSSKFTKSSWQVSCQSHSQSRPRLQPSSGFQSYGNIVLM